MVHHWGKTNLQGIDVIAHAGDNRGAMGSVMCAIATHLIKKVDAHDAANWINLFWFF